MGSGFLGLEIDPFDLDGGRNFVKGCLPDIWVGNGSLFSVINISPVPPFRKKGAQSGGI